MQYLDVIQFESSQTGNSNSSSSGSGSGNGSRSGDGNETGSGNGSGSGDGGDETNTCVYSTWTEWSSCSASCQSSRSRTLLVSGKIVSKEKNPSNQAGDPATCEATNGPLTNSMLCEGDDCSTQRIQQSFHEID